MRSALVGFLAVVFLTGCTSSSQPPARKHIADLSNYLGQYAAANGNKAPPSEDAFKKFLAETRKKTEHEDVLISPTDKEPYVIRYGVSYQQKLGKEGNLPPSQLPKIVAAHEKNGAEGKIWVAYAGGLFEQIEATSLPK
ncbi:MAG: hypothetical protein U0744_04995 [Gemmataceae bacterium]